MPEQDYSKITKEFRDMTKAAIAEWFVSTEPGEKPSSTRITSTKRADLIGNAMIGKIGLDLTRCAKWQWRVGTPLPAKNEFNQPLHTDNSQFGGD